MLAFDPQDPTRLDRVDWEILKFGASRIFNHQDLDEAHQWLQNHQYHILQFTCTHWQSSDDFLDAIVHTLHILDEDAEKLAQHRGDEDLALTIFARGLANLDVMHTEGVALIFWQFEQFYQTMPDFACSILELIEYHSRQHLLIGGKLISLLHSEDSYPGVFTIGGNKELHHPI